MIGNPSASTSHVINHAPGTFGTVADFARDPVTGERATGSLGSIDWVTNQHAADTVTFVYTDDA